MSYSQTVDPQLASLTALVEDIVKKVLGEESNKQLTSWAVNDPRISSHLSYQFDSVWENGSGNQVFGELGQLAKTWGAWENYRDEDKARYTLENPAASMSSNLQTSKPGNDLINFGGKIESLAGVYDAYKSGDPLGGAIAGYEFGPVGAAVGFLAGLFGGPPDIDRWDRPKFTAAKKAYETQFVVDRGERNSYYLPDSFYFRTGSTNGGQLVIKIGDEQLNDHIRDSLTNSYASQLQRGLVF